MTISGTASFKGFVEAHTGVSDTFPIAHLPLDISSTRCFVVGWRLRASTFRAQFAPERSTKPEQMRGQSPDAPPVTNATLLESSEVISAPL
jgi:hypothetical protein